MRFDDRFLIGRPDDAMHAEAEFFFQDAAVFGGEVQSAAHNFVTGIRHVASGYSSDVRLRLIVGKRTLEVEQVLRETCLLAEPIDHPPCEGELVMHVDGRRRRRYRRRMTPTPRYWRRPLSKVTRSSAAARAKAARYASLQTLGEKERRRV